jgi:hypothetical protein
LIDIIQYAFAVQVGLKIMMVLFNTSVIALGINWPLAYAIQVIPGFSEVL